MCSSDLDWKTGSGGAWLHWSVSNGVFAQTTGTAPVCTPPSSFTVAVVSNPVAGGSATGGGVYASGASVTVTATANTGYRFVNWSEAGNTVSTNATYTFNVQSNRTLTANFSQISITNNSARYLVVDVVQNKAFY